MFLYNSDREYEFNGCCVEEKRLNDHFTDICVTRDNLLIDKFILHDKDLLYKEHYIRSGINHFDECTRKGIARYGR